MQVQLWIQSIVAAIIKESKGGTLPTEMCEVIWDNALEFERVSVVVATSQFYLLFRR